MTDIVIEVNQKRESVVEILDGPTLVTELASEKLVLVETPGATQIVETNGGPRGARGSIMHVGPAYPPIELGQSGDTYLITQGQIGVGDVYTKGVIGWTLSGNVRGPAGGIESVNGQINPNVVLTKYDIGLGNVDNTSDANKPVSTPTQQQLDKKIQYNDWLQYSNPFNNVRRLYQNELHNALFRAESRWTVTGKTYRKSDNVEQATLSASELAGFFNGDYEGFYTIPLGQYLLVTISFDNEFGGLFPGYPYGRFLISHYYNQRSASQSMRVFTTYAPHGGPAWKTLTPTALVDAASSQVVQFDNQNYQITTMEFRVDSPDTGLAAWVTQIEMNADRIGNGERPVVDKYRINNMYSDLRFKSGGTNSIILSPSNGAVTANNFIGGGASLTALNGTNISTGTVADARLSSNVALLTGTQTFSGSKTFSTSTAFPNGLSSDGSTNIRAVGIKPVGDHGYISFYSRDASPSTRTAYIGVGSAASTQFSIVNEMTNGNIAITPSGTGIVNITSGTLQVSTGNLVVSSGTISGNGSSITALSGSAISTGTVADARLSSNVMLLTGNQTVSGVKTYSADIIMQAATLNINTPNAGGWARGMHFRDNAGAATTGGFGMLGNVAAPTHLYMGYGTSPWDGSIGLRIVAAGDATFSHSVTATSFSGSHSGSGANLTALNGTNISTGTVADARLSSNVNLLNAAQTVSGIKTFSAATLIAAGFGNNTARPAVGSARIAGEISAYGQSLGGDDGFLRLSAGGGTSAGSKSYIDLSGYSQVADMSANIVIGTGGTERIRVNSTAATFTVPITTSQGVTASTFTGNGSTLTGLSKTQVGLSNVDNTSDANKPVSTAQQTALNLKANLASPTFTGTVSGITASMVGLGNVANLAQVDLVNAQTIAGIKTFSATPVFSSGISVTGTATATTFSGSGASLTALNGSNITSGTIPQSVLTVNTVRVVHGSTASTARPTGATYVEWIGSVQPTNMATNDTWVNTSGTGAIPENHPAGTLLPTASAKSTPPSGWYFSEGQEILISGDTTLYNELTNNGSIFPYGANTNGSGGAGSTHFRLPNMLGKVIVHADGSTEFTSIGKTGGTKSETLTIAQVPRVTASIQAHSSFSAFWTPEGAFSTSTLAGQFSAPSSGGTQANSINKLIFDNGGGGGSHNNLQPFMVLRYIIKR